MAADTRAVLRALKATQPTGGGYGTVTPPAISQGASPLVASYNEWTSGHAYGTNTALPREWMSFLSGAFGPGTPLQPTLVDMPQPGEDRPEPRRFQYPVSWDLPMGMPGTEGLGKLADFNTLRTIADYYSVARACIELRKSELRGIGWDIALTKDAAKALRGSQSGMKDFADRRAKAVKFFQRPDPDYENFSTWFDAILEEVFVTDSLSVYVHPARQKGKGLLGSHVGALDLLDGTLIRPLVDIRGGRPVPPNPAFQQYQYGVPRVDLLTLLTEDDPAGLVAEYAGDQLLYLPYSRRTWTPYGQAPIERAIIPVMSGISRQQYQLNYFQEGSIPGLFVSPGDMNMTPSQIRELQDALNTLAGDQAWKHKIIVLPGGSKVDPQKPAALADQFDEIIMTQVCMAFNVMPMELGITPRVSTTQSVGAANQMAKASQDTQERKGTVPLLLWLKSAIFDRILKDVCGQEDLEWSWEGLEEDEDAETLTNLLVQQVGAGMRSIDEARQELGLDPWGIPATSDPGWASQMNGFVPFSANPAVDPELQGQLANQQLAQAQQRTVQARQMTQAGPQPPGQPGQKPGQPASQQGKPGGQSNQGKSPAKHLPAGAGQRPATTAPRGAGGPNSPSTPGTPAHAAATAGTTGSTAKKPAVKGGRELDLLAAHLRKGGTIAQWQPRDLPGALLAAIDEDLGKGLSPDEACSLARAGLPKNGHADLASHVHAYLSRHYPSSVLGWVGQAHWSGPASVPLSDINMARRNQSARDPAKVDSIAADIEAGKRLDPVVLVQVPGKDQLQIADGWHRTLAARHAGRHTVMAYVGEVGTPAGPWDGEMNAAKLNKAGAAPFTVGDGASDGGGAGPKAPAWPGWEHDRQIAGRYAALIAAELRATIPARDLARAWLAGRIPPAATTKRWAPGQWLTLTGLTAAITATLRRHLAGLWTEAWHTGRDAALQVIAALQGPAAARAAAAATETGMAAAIQQMIAQATGRIAGMTQTRIDRLMHVLEHAATALAAAGVTALARLEHELARTVEEELGDEGDAERITQTEVTWAMAAAALAVYCQAGAMSAAWQTAEDGRVCAVCEDNEGAGFIPAGEAFPSGDMAPPAHPRCRCCLLPGQFTAGGGMSGFAALAGRLL